MACATRLDYRVRSDLRAWAGADGMVLGPRAGGHEMSGAAAANTARVFSWTRGKVRAGEGDDGGAARCVDTAVGAIDADRIRRRAHGNADDDGGWRDAGRS